MTWLKRFMRHVWMSPLIARRAFTDETLRAIEVAVATCEQTHRGQVRFVVEAELTTQQLWSGLTSRARAVEVFSGLRVWDTEENNGVLIYVLLADRKVEIIADRGIHAKVGTERWRAICKEMELHFRKRDFREGSVNAIHKVGVELAFYFPSHGHRTNEQSDKPVML
ncbi:MAG: TPM domain-containing protein [Burkholderiales bacterium]|jgi:uncharacterized membrane protein|nr:TPM domain-containing protein [Rhodocyclaceae bacterium]MCE2724640.1 TPM domain-containing protein [Betaproteobacteria bacterium]MCA3017688.1 TPM domain-containing protein [Rhodocyclaceae bacterium]MCA3023271.1 TPM domain-containing protein [Rhodocyclaceae bacterium]MCA3024033.1 TPM domain-containing protein [Rhodocyclaceae bacterium]